MGTPWSYLTLAMLVLTAVSHLAPAQEGIVTQRGQFARAASSATITGTLTGSETRAYLLAAQAGQTMRVQMATKNTFLSFNVLPPHSDEALVVGQNQADPQPWAGTLPTAGDYRLRVYLVRAEARRGGTATLVCTVSITK
jgi:hypothetical protein